MVSAPDILLAYLTIGMAAGVGFAAIAGLARETPPEPRPIMAVVLLWPLVAAWVLGRVIYYVCTMEEWR